MESAQPPSTAKKKQNRVRKRQKIGWAIALALAAGLSFARSEQDVTVAWDPSVTPGVTGYVLYYAASEWDYFDFIMAGPGTMATVPSLTEGVTYFFAAAAYDRNGIESDLSQELRYTVPGGTGTNRPPTLNPIKDVTLSANSAPHTVTLTGIGASSPAGPQALRVAAMSSNPYLVSTPIVAYTSPEQTGSLTFSSLAGKSGTVTITVTVDDGPAANNVLSQTFTVTVEPPTATAPLYLEAESGTLSSPMRVGSDPKASNGRYIYSSSSEQGVVSLRFDVAETDNYFVWCRVLSVDSSTDSFYVSVDSGAEDIYRTALNNWSAQWQWTRVSDGTTGSPRQFALGQGSHTLKFRGRESSTLLDAVYVTNDPDFVPLKVALAPVSSPVRGMQISFQGSAGYQYRVEATEDFRAWTNIWSSPVATAGQSFSVVDTASTMKRMRFYRVEIIPPAASASAAPAIRLAVAPEPGVGRGMRISFQSAPGRQYQLQASEDLRSWIPLWDAPVTPDAQLSSYVDAAGLRTRFYRVQLGN